MPRRGQTAKSFSFYKTVTVSKKVKWQPCAKVKKMRAWHGNRSFTVKKEKLYFYLNTSSG
jgi:hypothetical protein